jgi:mannose/fructose/N-acetylgalactosamine-specific phosphotransferase system component IID
MAVILTFVGFNLIVFSPAMDLLRIGKKAGNEIIANVLVKEEAITKLSGSS